VQNSEIAAVFDNIAELLEAKKDNIFKIRAYRKVARAIEELDRPVEQLVSENRVGEIPGAGEAITKKIHELVNTGKLEYLEKLRKESPEQIPSANA
jgi:DNA polymerase (family 10)